MTDAELQRILDELQERPTEARLTHAVAALHSRHRTDEARRWLRAYLMHDPENLAVMAMLERLSAPAPAPRLRGRDPYLTVSRAEAYARVGRHDLAARTYRRLLYDHPGELGILARLEQLGQAVRPMRQPTPVLDAVAEWGDEVTVKVGWQR